MPSAWSETIRFNLAFSSSSSFKRRASEISMPPVDRRLRHAVLASEFRHA